MKKNEKKICLIGNGWGAQAALEGLLKKFQNIIIVSDDNDILDLANKYNLKINEKFLNTKADFFIFSGYTEFVNKSFLDSNKAINIHYSLLPKFRGLHSTVWSVLNNEKFFGLTIHIMNEKIDDGDILYQYKFKNNGQNSREIIEECNTHISENISCFVKDYLSNKIKPIPQNKDAATWCCKRNHDDCLIDFDKSVDDLRLFFLALVEPYPLPRIKIKNLTIEVIESYVIKSDYVMTNGRVINIESGKVFIKLSDGILVLKKIRDALNKKPLNLENIFKLGMRLQ